MSDSGDYYRALVRGELCGFWPSLERGMLWAASQPYGWMSGLRNRLYDRGWQRCYRARVPVVSVGNLTLGGTGKTPCVEYIAVFYANLGCRVVVLSRGYAGGGTANDEASVLAANLPGVPHLQGRDRVALARQAIGMGAEVLVLDDGFQHRRLVRDLDIVLIDASEPWQEERMFPRGFLRESREELGRAHVVVLTRADQVDQFERGRLREVVARIAPDAVLVLARHRPLCWLSIDGSRHDLQALAHRPVAAFCGLGHPDAFRRTLIDLGMRLCAFRSFPDHHSYTAGDMEDLAAWRRQWGPECVLVTTQKDLVKMRPSQSPGLDPWALKIAFDFQAGQDALDRKLKEAIGERTDPFARRHGFCAV
jgi:tetraacyldisaccharide 4'-kinase